MKKMPTHYNLYKATIEDCYDYSFTKGDDSLKKNFQDKIASKKFGNEIDTKVSILHTLSIGMTVKGYKVMIKEEITKFFGNLLNFSSIDLDINITNNDEYYYAYGILCGFICLLDPNYEEEHKNFNFIKYKNYSEVIKQSQNYKEMEGYFKNRYKSFLKDNKDKKNLEMEWYKILFDKKLSTLSIPSKIKKKKIKKKEKSLSTENKENTQKEKIDEEQTLEKEEDIKDEKIIPKEEELENTEFSLSSDNSIREPINVESITSEIETVFNNSISMNVNNEAIDNLKSFLKESFEKIIKDNKKNKKAYKELEKRVTALENHVVLLTNHMTLFQTSRDIGKSIFHYLYKHFNLKDTNSLSDETEKVMDYIGSDVNAEKVDELLDEESKKKLNKFFKMYIFH